MSGSGNYAKKYEIKNEQRENNSVPRESIGLARN